MGESFERKNPGDRISADEYNRLTAAVERADGIRGAGGILVSRTAAATSVALEADSPFVLVRMLADSVVQENARRAAKDGELPSLYNAILQTWDDRVGGWMDAEEQYLWVDNPCGIPVNADDWAVCCKEPASGRTVVIPNGVIQLAVTVADPNLSGSGAPSGSGDGGSGGFSGDYPPESLRPSTYCINFIGLPYPPIPGVNRVPADVDDVQAGEIAPSVLGPAGRPHATVMNLYQGDDSYLKEGTVVWCFMAGGKWYTYMMKPGGASAAATGRPQRYAIVREYLLVDHDNEGSGLPVPDPCGRVIAQLMEPDDPCAWAGSGGEIVLAPTVASFYVGRVYEVHDTGLTVHIRPAGGSAPDSGSHIDVEATETGTYRLFSAEGEIRKEVVIPPISVTCVEGEITVDYDTAFIYTRGVG